MPLLLTRCGPVGSWSPASATGLALDLLVADARTAGRLWQDAAKTVPATANGHPVRVAQSVYSAAEWVAPSDSARPALFDEGSGAWSLSFDGADDTLACALGSAGQPSASGLSAVFYGRVQTDVSLPLSRVGSTSPQWRVQQQTTARMTALVGSGSAAEAVVSLAPTYTASLIGSYDRVSVRLRKDRDTEVSVAETRDWWFNPSGEVVAIASVDSGFNRMAGRVRACLLYTSALTPTDQTLLLDYLGLP